MALSVKRNLFAVALAALTLGGCLEGNPIYFPLEGGRDWSYGVTLENAKGISLQKSFVTNLPSSNVKGEKLTPRRLHNGEVYFYKETDDGVVRVAANRPGRGLSWESEPTRVLGYPLTPGTRWTQEEQSYLFHEYMGQGDYNEIVVPMLIIYEIESVDEVVKVPAGVFNNCIKVKGLGETSVRVKTPNALEDFIDLTVETTQWFTPRVGLVKSKYHEASSNPRIVGGDYMKVLEKF